MIDLKAKAKPLYFILVALVITSLATLIAGTANVTEDDNSTVEKAITLSLEYASDSNFDRNNDGVAALKGAIDFTVTNSEFSWLYDAGSLCTKWEIYSEENSESTIICHGSEACCNMMGLEPYQSNWNDNLVLTYERFGSTKNNEIIAQIIAIEDPENAVYSDESSLTAKFQKPSEQLTELEAKLKIRNKMGRDVGEGGAWLRGDGKFDIEIKQNPRGLRIASADKDWNIKIKGANKLDFESIVDELDDDMITTEVIAIENLTLEEAEVTLPKNGNVNVILRCDDFDIETFTCTEWTQTNIPFVDNGDTITFNVTHFSGYAGGQITIIDLQSYPIVGDDWTVRFTTVGEANLTISAIEETTYGTELPDDLIPLELRCGSETTAFTWDGSNEATYEDYQCNETSYWIVKVLTTGVHEQKFEFGGSVGYANNLATNDTSQHVTPSFVNVSRTVRIKATWSTGEGPYIMLACRNESTCGPNAVGWPPGTQLCYYDNSSGDGELITDSCYCWNVTTPSINSIKCAYPTQSSDPELNYVYSVLYNASSDGRTDGILVNTTTTGFLLNHRPYAYNVNVTPVGTAQPNYTSTLRCNYNFSDMDAGDTQSAVNFTWLVKRKGTTTFILNGTSTQTFSGGFFGRDEVKCGVKVTDNHGFSDNVFVNSTNTIIINNTLPGQPQVNITPMLPSTLQNLTCNVTINASDPDRDVLNYTYEWRRNGTLIRSFGPFNSIYDVLHSGNTSRGEVWNCAVTPYDGVGNGITSSAIITIVDNAPAYDNYTVNNTQPSYGDMVKLSANWTDDVNLSEAILQLNYTGTFVNYSTIPLTGRLAWSNFTFNTTENGLGTVQWKIIVSDIGGNWNTSMPINMFNITDRTIPVINISSIVNYSVDTIFTLEFNVSDDYMLNISTLLVNVTNSSNSVYHVLENSTLYNPMPWTFGENMTCINITDSKFYTCSLTINLSDSRYNISFTVNDTSGNQRVVNISDYIVDTRPFNVTNVYDGFCDGGICELSDHSTTISLFANWTAVPTPPAYLHHYDLAIGTGATYLSPGWNDLMAWTNVSTNTSVNLNLSLNHNERYYFHVRALDILNQSSNVTSSDGVFYEDDSPPLCLGWNPATGDGCIHDEGDWTRSTTHLYGYWNFTDNGSDLYSYKYAIGTTRYPIPGWNNTFGVHETENSYAHVDVNLIYNVTYIWSVKARNENPNAWSQFYYSDNITVDNVPPYNGSISYNGINTTHNLTVVNMNLGVDDLSTVDYGILMRDRAPVQSASCSGWLGYANIGTYTSSTSATVNLTHGYCYRFKLKVYDHAGNSKEYTYSNELNFYSDSTPPGPFQVNVSNTDGFIFDPELDITWSIPSDPESGISRYKYMVNDSDGNIIKDWTNTTSRSVIVDPSNWDYEIQHLVPMRVYVIAYNGVGLTSSAVSESVTYKDDIPPNPVVVWRVENDTNVSDAYGWWDDVNNGITNVTSYSDENVSAIVCYYSEYDMDYIDAEAFGEPCVPSGNNDNITCNISVSEGEYTYHINCKDGQLGKQSALENTDFSFTVDWRAPSLSITSPVDGYNFSIGDNVTLTATVQDLGSGIETVWYYVQSYSTGEIILSDTIQISGDNDYLLNLTWNTSSLLDRGTYIFAVYVNDSFGQLNYGIIDMVANNTVPVIGAVILNSTTGYNYTYDNLTVHVINASDGDNDSIKNIYNWYINNVSLAVLNMPFEDESTSGVDTRNGSTKDFSGYGNDGLVVGATWVRDGGSDSKGAYEFDGTGSDYIDLGKLVVNVTNSTPFTYAAWIKMKGRGGSINPGIIYTNGPCGGNPGGSGAGLSIRNNNSIGFDVHTSCVQDDTITYPISNDTWYYVVGVYDTTTLYLYVDGVLVNSTTRAAPLMGSTYNTAIGNDLANAPVRGFNGTIDEVLILNRTLTAAQIKSIYENGLSKIVSEQTNKGETWYVGVTPTDGVSEGMTYYSNNLTIPANRAGIVGVAFVNTTSGGNYTFDDLMCYANATDLDNDEITFSGEWYLDGSKYNEPLLTLTYATANSDIAKSAVIDSQDNLILAGVSNDNYITIKYDSDGNEIWMETSNPGNSDSINAIAIDSLANVVVTGKSQNVTGTNSYDYYTIKYDSDGNQIWNKTYASIYDDEANGVAIDSLDNIYVTGRSKNVTGTKTDWDYYTIKYNSSGNEIWNKTYSSVYSDSSYAIAIDSSDKIYITGATYNATGIGTYDYYTIKYDSDGNQIWNKTYDSTYNDIAYGVTLDTSDNIYITGVSYNASGTETIDSFTIKYDSNGNTLWSAVFDSGQTDTPEGIAIDSSDNIYLTGYNDSDYFTLKYDSYGNYMWNKTYDGGSSDSSYAIAIDSSDNIYITGKSYNLTGTDTDDIYTIKYLHEFAKLDQPYNDLIHLDTLDSSLTSKGQNWTCAIRVYDGETYSAYTFTNEISIPPNRLPIVGPVVLNVTSPNNWTQDNLSCYANATDLDLDAISFSGEWYKNGQVNVAEVWNASFDSADRSDRIYDIALDSLGNVYVTGFSDNTTGTSNSDYFTAKYDTNGNYLWNRTYDSSLVESMFEADYAKGIALDSSNNVYVTGYSSNLTTSYIFTIKYDTNGNQLWNKTYNSEVWNYAYDLAIDQSDNIYVAASSYDNTDFAASIVKYDTNGNQLWNISYNTTYDDEFYGITLDSSNNVYVTGWGYNTTGTTTDELLIVKYDENGTQLWNKSYSIEHSKYGVYGESIALDSLGNIYVAGVSYNTTGVDGTYDYFTIKSDSSGNQLWNKSYDSNSTDRAYAIAVDSSHNVYVTGSSFNVSGTDESDFFTIKYDTNGNQLWNKTYDSTNVDGARAIALDSSGHVYIAGEVRIAALNNDDAFTIKYKDGFSKANQPYNDIIHLDTLDSSITSKGDNWTCVIRVSDGEGYSTKSSNNLSISILNRQPYFLHNISDMTSYVGVEFIYDVNASDTELETLTYIDNASLGIDSSTGLINWTPSSRAIFDVNIQACDTSGQSNNCTEENITMTVKSLSTIISSTIAGNWHAYNVTADIAGIIGSIINISTIVGPTINTTDSIIYNSDIIDSTILRCNISDSDVNATDCTDSVIDPSDVKDSNITDSIILDSHVWYSNVTDSNITDSTVDYSNIDNSNVTDSTTASSVIENSRIINSATVTNSTIINSTIDGSTISNSTVTNSTITNSSVFDAVVLNANITNDVLVSGNITWNGITTEGPKNLTDAVNYPPNAVSIPTSASGTDSVTVTFNATTSTDPNIPGDLNDYLSYAWDFNSNGTIDNTSNVTSHTYTSSATATLTVTDKFGKSDSTTIPITVNSGGVVITGSPGGGSSRGTSSYAAVPIQLTDDGIYVCLRLNEAAAFTFDDIAYSMTLKQFGTTYAVLNLPGIEGNMLSGDLYMEKNESTKFDLNNNGYFDFYMKFNDTTQTAACFDIRSIIEEMTPDQPQILEPSTQIPEPTEEILQRPARPRPSPRTREPAPAFDESKPSPLTDILIKVLPIALLAMALLGVVLHKMTTVTVKGKIPAIDMHIANSLAKGKHLNEVHQELLQRGLSEESIYAAELKHVIMKASKKMNLKDVQDQLVRKGWPEDMVKSAILGHFVRAHIAKGKPFEQVKSKLLKAGWREEDIHEHLKRAS